MKGGVVLSLGVMRALASPLGGLRRGRAAARLRRGVADGALRPRRALRGLRRLPLLRGRASARPDGDDGVVVRRKAAGTVSVRPEGRAAHSGSAPDRGRNALLALARPPRRWRAATTRTGPRPDRGPDRAALGRGVQRRAGRRGAVSDMRADPRRLPLVVDAIPAEVGGATLHPGMVRLWPGMDATDRDGAAARACRRVPRTPGGRDAARGRATRATSPPRSRSRSTGSGRAAAPPTIPRSTSSPTRSEPRAAVALALASAALSRVIASDSSSRGRSIAISSPRLRRGGSRPRRPS